MIKDRVKARPSWKKHRGVKPLMETVTEETESLKKTCPSLPLGQGAREIPVPAEFAHKGRAIKTRTWDRTQKVNVVSAPPLSSLCPVKPDDSKDWLRGPSGHIPCTRALFPWVLNSL